MASHPIHFSVHSTGCIQDIRPLESVVNTIENHSGHFNQSFLLKKVNPVMKKILQPLIVLLMLCLGNQLKAQDIDFTVRYNPTSGEYEVYALPDFSDPAYFVGGGSQISLVLPASIADSPLSITTVNGGFWTDNSRVFAPAADPNHDFHGIASNGSSISLVAGEEMLMYTFTLPGGGCIGGIRLYENGSDPNSAAPGMGGGDFENYFANAFTFLDNYNANYDNAGTTCNPPLLAPNPITIMMDSTGMVCAPISDPDVGDTFTAMSCGANNGSETVTLNGSEVCVEYTPVTGYTGTDSVCVIICDQLGACDTTFFPVTVIPPLPPATTPEPPVVIPTPITTPEDSTVTVCTPVLDPNAGDTFTANLCVGSPENGTATPTIVNGQLCIEYTPDNGFSGDDEVCVIVCDQTGLCDTVEIPVTVIPTVEPPSIPQPPVVVFPPIVGPEDSTVTACGPIVDPNPEDTHTVTICEQPANATATATVDNDNNALCITIDPDDNFNGVDSVCVIVCDQTGLCDTLNIPIEIMPGNDAPNAIDDINTTPIDEPVMGSLLPNDEDPDGDSLIINTTPVGTPTGGTVVINPDGTYTFTPDPGFTGEGGFQYEVCDNGMPQMCDTADVVIEVFDFTDPNNNAPVGTEDNFVTEEGSNPVMGDLLANDNDPDGDDLTIDTTPVTDPTNGTVTINPDGTFTYTPDPAFEGEDTFEYEVCDDGSPIECDTVLVTIEVLPNDGMNDIYATDDAGMGAEDSPITGNLLANDNDPEGHNLTITTTPLDTPMNGTVMINPDGTYEYTPDPNFSGNDQFTYQVCDDGIPMACDSATVYITVVPVNEILATDDINTTPINTDVTGNVLTNDEDEEGDSLIINTTPIGTPVGGSVVINPDGSYTFTPDTDFVGEGTFQYEVCDNGDPVACDTATVTVEVFDNTDPDNNPIVGVTDNFTTEEGSPVTGSLIDNDFDPDGDSIIINTTPVIDPMNGTVTINPDGTFTYTPDPDFEGEDTFEYQVCDDGTPVTCDTVEVMIEVLPDNGMNDLYATDDAGAGEEDMDITGNVASNDNDPEGDDLMVTTTPVEAPMNGTLVLNPDGTYTYTPDPDYVGNDQFVYEICDDGSPMACDTATVYLTVTESQNPPLVIPNPLTIPQDSTGTICAPITDTNDGDTFTATLCGADNGTPSATVNGNEVCIEYIPNTGFSGTDSVCVIVCDQTGLCDTTFVPVTVVAPLPPSIFPEPPVGIPTPVTTLEDSTVTVCSPILDPNVGDTFTANLCVGSPENGSATPTVNGSELCIEYTPDAGFTGDDEVCVIICDQTGLCDTIGIPVTIIPMPEPPDSMQPPVVTFPPVVTPSDSIPTVCAPIVDPNPLDTHTVTICEQPANGTATAAVDNMNGAVCVTINPDDSFSGTDSVCVIVCDQTGLCDTINIPIVVTPGEPNNPPIVIGNPLTIPEDSTGNICVPIMDADMGDTFTATLCGAENGTPTATVNGDELCIEYIPDSGYTGTDSVCVIVCDQAMGCDTSFIPVTVVPSLPPSVFPEPPVVIVTPTSTPQDSTVEVCTPILDPNVGDTFTANLCVGSPANGSATPTVNGGILCVAYTPDTGFTGDDEVCVIVCDQTGLCDTVGIPVTVIPPIEPVDSTQPPIVVFPPVVTPVDSTGEVCAPIADPNPLDTHTVTICEQPMNATATATVDNSTGAVCLSIDPDAGFEGTDSVCVVVCDQTGLCDTVIVPIEVIPSEPMDPPVVLPTPLVIPQDSTGEVCINILDPNDGDTFTASICGVNDGTATPTLTGSVLCIEYTPDPGFNGTDSICIIACDQTGLCDTTFIPVTVVEPLEPSTTPEPPVVIETTGVTPEDSTITVCTPILDPNVGDTFTANLCVGSPANGTATPTVNGGMLCLEYTPDAGFTGDDEVCIIVCDQTGLCDTTQITVTVVPTIQPPTIPQPPVVVFPPIVGPEDSTTTTCGPIVDPNPLDTHTVTICEQPANAMAVATVDNATGTLCLTIDPDPNFFGEDSVCVIVCDQTNLCDTLVIPITILEDNEVIAIDDINSTQTGVMTAGNVLTNDDDPEGDNLTVNTVPVGNPVGGTLVLMTDGSYTFMPNPGFTGEAMFRYEVCDDGIPMACDTATVLIDVIDNTDPNNNQVIGNEDNVVTEEGITTTINVLSNDTDPDGDNLVINTNAITSPTNGTVTIMPDGTITYTPDPDFVGTETFEYEVCDDGAPVTCDTVLVTIEVLEDDGENDVYATDDAGTGNMNQNIGGNVLDNDNDPEGDNLTVTTTPVVGPANGTLTLNTDGTYTYEPDPMFTGNDQFIYSVCDDGSPVACDTATVYLTVLATNYPPTVTPNPITIPEDSTGTVCMPISDPNMGDTFTATICGADNGTPSATIDGATLCVTYEPDPGFSGTDSVCVIVCDQTGLCDTTFVPVTVVEPLPPSTTPEPPVVIITPLVVPEDSTGTICTPILDPNAGDTFTANLCVGSPANGSATPTVNGGILCLEYTPDPGFNGDDEICVIVCDQTGLCDTVGIPVTVIPQVMPPDSIQPPVVIFPPIVGPADSTTITCTPIVDPNPGDTHTVTICEQPANATATATVDNTTGTLCLEIEPDAGFVGEDSVCVIVCDQTGLCDTVNVPIMIVPSITKLELKVLLQGAMLFTNDGQMRDDLRTMGVIPTNQPYSASLHPRFTHVGGGNETTTPLILSQNAFTGDAVVDWIFLEIRDAADSTSVIRTISALVQRDGDIVDASTGTTLCVSGLPSSFFVAVKHRNHLGAMTAEPTVASGGTVIVDFTTMGDADLHDNPSTSYDYDGLEQTTMSGRRALWAGNANADSKVKYDGSANDRIKLANDVLTFPGNSTSLNLNYDNALGYFQGDVDMNGKAKYDGALNDRIIIQNIVLTYPLNSLILNNFNDLLEQLP